MTLVYNVATASDADRLGRQAIDAMRLHELGVDPKHVTFGVANWPAESN